MKCPVCRTSYNSLRSPSNLCRRCGVDLLPLINLHDQALWYHRQAIQSLQEGDYAGAITQNNQALALHYNNADFHTLRGQLWALQGKFRQAIAAWKKAQQINPHHLRAGDYLECFLGNDRG